LVFLTKSVLETIRIGKWVGGQLSVGDVVALFGDLGAGKTHFVKGLAAGVAGVKPDYVSSPSYTLINEYEGKTPFYHIDLYRLISETEAEELGIEEYLHGKGVTAIEWADKILSLLPRELLDIRIQYTGERTRSIELRGKGSRYEDLVKKMEGLKPNPQVSVLKD
jgi:tRNA threonylcarbamoyladenosine biosynthesis protein TsaE